MPQRIVVCGSRIWDDLPLIASRLRLIPEFYTVGLIHGDCTGADRQAANAAMQLGFRSVTAYPADWARYGSGAGPIRNGFMLDENPVVVIAFHDDVEHSRGTRNMIEQAISRKIPVELISHEAHELRTPNETLPLPRMGAMPLKPYFVPPQFQRSPERG